MAEVKVIVGSEAFGQAMIKDPPRPFAPVSLYLYAACLIGFLASTVNGYDGSLLNNLFINPTFEVSNSDD